MSVNASKSSETAQAGKTAVAVEKPKTLRHATGGSEAMLALQRAAGNRAMTNLLGRSGRPLDSGTRKEMEARFGEDFSDVKIHRDEAGANTAISSGARAVTSGHDVAFAPGFYTPGTPNGRLLLAHELAHVVQQGRRGETTRSRSESDANRAAARAAGGQNAQVETGASGTVQADPLAEEEIRGLIAQTEAKVAKATPQQDLDQLFQEREALRAQLPNSSTEAPVPPQEAQQESSQKGSPQQGAPISPQVQMASMAPGMMGMAAGPLQPVTTNPNPFLGGSGFDPDTYEGIQSELRQPISDSADLATDTDVLANTPADVTETTLAETAGEGSEVGESALSASELAAAALPWVAAVGVIITPAHTARSMCEEAGACGPVSLPGPTPGAPLIEPATGEPVTLPSTGDRADMIEPRSGPHMQLPAARDSSEELHATSQKPARPPRASFRPEMRDALEKASEPDHPLYRLTEASKTGSKAPRQFHKITRITKSGKTRTGRYHGGETEPVVQAGHSEAYVSGAPQKFMLEDADFNQLSGNMIESKGALSSKKRLLVTKPDGSGGIWVHAGSLEQWERLGAVPKGTVEAAIQRTAAIGGGTP